MVNYTSRDNSQTIPSSFIYTTLHTLSISILFVVVEVIIMAFRSSASQQWQKIYKKTDLHYEPY